MEKPAKRREGKDISGDAAPLHRALEGVSMEQQDVDRLIATLDSRFVSWRSMVFYLIPSYLLTITVPIGVATYLGAQHASQTAHPGAVTQREIQLIGERELERWQAMDVRLRAIESQLRALAAGHE
jgi:hypothetical protein